MLNLTLHLLNARLGASQLTWRYCSLFVLVLCVIEFGWKSDFALVYSFSFVSISGSEKGG